MKEDKDAGVAFDGESIRIIVSPSDFAKNNLFYVIETGYIDGELFSGGGHDNLDSFLLLYVCDGEVILDYDNIKYLIKKNSMFVIDCNKHHKLYTHNNKAMWALYLYFNGIQTAGYYDLISKSGITVFEIENKKTIMSLLWQIVSLNQKKAGYAELLTSLNITRILTDVCMFCSNDAIHEAEYPDCVNYTYDYIAKNYNKKITLSMLSELFFVNKYHLSREFKRCAGITINEHLTTIRINKARALLRYSNKSVEEIAIETGFCNATHFIRVFRKNEQVTPLFYRNQWTI
ncbi:MAG: AraC family transcriptional regulator [Eubacteriales bacterium]|nr:AraC family transcriptional regulator [Eubacteriales bacterium]